MQICVLNRHRNPLRLDMAGPKPPSHRLRQGKQHNPGCPLVRHVKGNRGAVSIIFILRLLRLNHPGVPAVSEIPDHLPVLLQMIFEKLRIRLRQVSNGADSQTLQAGLCGSSYKKQLPHRKRPHFLRNLLRKQSVNQIRLLKIRRHLRQQLIGGNADIDRKTQFPENPLPDSLRRLPWRTEQLFHADHVHKGLVNTVLLHLRRIFLQNLYKGL